MKLDHVCIVTSDSQSLIAWYKDKLGFEFIQEWTVDAMPGLNLTYIGKDDFKIEIVGDMPVTDEEKLDPLTSITPGYNHFAVSVEDIEATLSDLEQKGVIIVAPETELPQAGIKAAMILDLDQNLIEIIEKIPNQK